VSLLYYQWYTVHNLSVDIQIQRLILEINSKLTPRARVLVGSKKLIFTQLVKKSFAYHRTWMFVTVFMIGHHWFLSWTRWSRLILSVPLKLSWSVVNEIVTGFGFWVFSPLNIVWAHAVLPYSSCPARLLPIDLRPHSNTPTCNNSFPTTQLHQSSSFYRHVACEFKGDTSLSPEHLGEFEWCVCDVLSLLVP
jgi:hypothetical protein